MASRTHSATRGFTVVELAVAMTILAAGTAILWYGIRSSARMDRLNRLHHAALSAARSDLESLRILPKQNIHDTAYPIAGPGGEPLRLIREVFDSTRIVSSLEDIALDEKMSPMELRKPLEVRVRVLLKPEVKGDGSAGSESSADWMGASEKNMPTGRVLVSLTLKLPEYKWY